MATRAQLRRIAAAALLCLGLFRAAGAWALDGDRILLRSVTTVTTDSNLFRLSPGTDPRLVIGTDDTSDTSRTETLGLSLDLPYARQRFTADLNASRTRFDNFSNLDYDGRDMRASWLWQAGSDLGGSLSSIEVRTLADFSNNQQRVRNIIDQRTDSAIANYRLYPAIHIEAGVTRLRLTDKAPERVGNDYTDDGLQLAVKHSPASGNSFGIRLRTNRVSYPNLQGVAGSLFASDYRQSVVEGLFDWQLSGHWRASGQAGVVNREYHDLSQRDFSGSVGSLSLDWTPTGKTAVNVGLRRELSAFQDLTTNYVLVQAISIRPTWTPTVKTAVQLSYDYEDLDYLGDPGFLLGVSERRADRVRSAGASFSYQPLRIIQVSLSWQEQERTSSLRFFDYKTRILTGSLQIRF